MTALSPGTQSKLMKTIAELVHEKTFTAEAIEGIKLLREECAKLETECIEKTERIAKLDNDYRAVVQERDTARTNCSAWAKRETDLLARETKITELEKNTAVANARTEVYANVFGTIFKNTTVRESVTRNVPVMTPAGGGYVQNQNESEHRTKDTE